MKFRFSLESVLLYRARLEEQARIAYVEAKQAVDTLLSEIENMYRRVDETRNEIHQESKASSTAPRLEFLSQFIDGQKIRIETARRHARELLEAAERKQEELIQAQRERKVLEKLKERRLLEYRKDRRRRETKQMDEIVTIRAGRGDHR